MEVTPWFSVQWSNLIVKHQTNDRFQIKVMKGIFKETTPRNGFQLHIYMFMSSYTCKRMCVSTHTLMQKKMEIFLL